MVSANLLRIYLVSMVIVLAEITYVELSKYLISMVYSLGGPKRRKSALRIMRYLVLTSYSI
jgi:hypothetical protein